MNRNFFSFTKKSVIFHYDALIDENNDPVFDSPALRGYMNRWDGNEFLSLLNADKRKSVLEIGIGTGRLAVRVAPLCGSFTGIDLSPKTVLRARENLSEFDNVSVICADFEEYEFSQKFDIVYSSLTFMHFYKKKDVVLHIYDILAANGRFVLSIDKSQEKIIDYGTRKITVYPDNFKDTEKNLLTAGFLIEKEIETEAAHIFAAVKKANDHM